MSGERSRILEILKQCGREDDKAKAIVVWVEAVTTRAELQDGRTELRCCPNQQEVVGEISATLNVDVGLHIFQKR